MGNASLSMLLNNLTRLKPFFSHFTKRLPILMSDSTSVCRLYYQPVFNLFYSSHGARYFFGSIAV